MNIYSQAFSPQVNASVVLPDELITEILSRLNVKSLIQLKCVCKSWNTLISNPIFIKMHLNLSKSKPNPHVALLSNGCPSNTVATISVTRLLQSTSNSITLTDDPYYQFKYIDRIVGSCNGLICLHSYYYYWDEKHLLYFWNPATKTKSETLLSLPYWYHVDKIGFGYDNSTDTYKAVVLGFNNNDGGGLRNQVAKVFTLGDNIWRDIQSFPVGVVLSSSSSPHNFNYDGVYLRNSISWLVRKNKIVIVSLDLGTETYTQLLVPSCCDELPLYNSNLCVLMDCICISHDFKGIHFVIWQMKEFGVEQSWTQFLKISYQNLGIIGYGCQLLPLCLSVNGATLILATNLGNQAILYNWRDNRVNKIEKPYGIWWCCAKDYVESLVSTC